MGGAQSTDTGDGSLWSLDFSNAESYLIEWDIEDLTTAFNLYFYTLGAVPPRRLNREQFSKVFDATKFDGLTMPKFDSFDSADKGTVFALEPLVLLALFCKGEHVDKSSFIFTAFDLNDDKSMSKDEITILVQCVVMALNSYGIVKMELLIADVMKMVDQTFGDAPINPDDALSDQVFQNADKNDDGVIDMDEFADWCATNLYVTTLVEGFDAFRTASYTLAGRPLDAIAVDKPVDVEAATGLVPSPTAKSPKPRVTIKMPNDTNMFRNSSVPDIKSPKTTRGLRKTKSFREQGKSFRNTDNVMDVMFAQMGGAYNSHNEMAKAVSVIAAKYRAHQAFAMVAEMKKNKSKVQDLLADAQNDAERAATEVKSIESQIASPVTSDEKKADLTVELEGKVQHKENMRRKSVQLERELHLHEMAEQAQDEAVEAINDYEQILDEITELAPEDTISSNEQQSVEKVEDQNEKDILDEEEKQNPVRKLSAARKKEMEAVKKTEELGEKAKAAEENASKTTDGLLELQTRLASTRRASVAKSLEDQIAQMTGSIENKRKQSAMLKGYSGLEQQADRVNNEAEKMAKEQAKLKQELAQAKAAQEEAERQNVLRQEERLKNLRPEVRELVRVKEYIEFLQGDVYTKRQESEEFLGKLRENLENLDSELVFGDKPKYQVKMEIMQHQGLVKFEKRKCKDLDETLDLCVSFKTATSKEEAAEAELAPLIEQQAKSTKDDGDAFYVIQEKVTTQVEELRGWHEQRVELAALLKAFKVSETMASVRAKLFSVMAEKREFVDALAAALGAGNSNDDEEVQQLKEAVGQLDSIIEMKHVTLTGMDATRLQTAERFEEMSGRIAVLDDECEDVDTQIFLAQKEPVDKDKDKEKFKQERLKQLKDTLKEKSAETTVLKQKAKPLSHVNNHLTQFYNKPAGRNVVKIARIAPRRPRHPGVVSDECAANGARIASKAAADATQLGVEAQAAAHHSEWLFNSCCTVAGRDVRIVSTKAQIRRRFQLQADITQAGAELVAEANAAIAALGLGVDANMAEPQRLISPRKSGSRPQRAIHGNSEKIPAHKIKRTFAADADDTPINELNVEMSTLKTHYIDIGDRTQDCFKLLKIFQRFDRHRDGSVVVKDLKRMLERGDRDLLDLLQVPTRVLNAGYFRDPIKLLKELFASMVNLEEDSEPVSFALFKQSFENYWLKISRQHSSLVLQATFKCRRAMTTVFLMRQANFRKLLEEKKAEEDAQQKLAAESMQCCERRRAARKELNKRKNQKALEERLIREAEERKAAETQRKQKEMLAKLERRQVEQQKEAERARSAAARTNALERRNSLAKLVQIRQSTEIDQFEEEKVDNFVYEDDEVGGHSIENTGGEVQVSRMPKRKVKADMTEEELLALREARLDRNEQTISLLANLRANSVQPRFKTRKGKEPGQSKNGPDAGTSWLLHMKRHAKCSSSTSIGGSVTELGAQLSVPQIPTAPTGPSMSQTPRHQRSHAQFTIRNRGKSASPRGRNHRNLHSAPPSRQVLPTGQNPFIRQQYPPTIPAPGTHAQSTQSLSLQPKLTRKARPNSAVYSHTKKGYRMKVQGSTQDLGIVQEQGFPPAQNNNAAQYSPGFCDQESLVLPQIPTRRLMKMPSFGQGMAKRPYPLAPPIDAVPLKQ